MPGRLLALDVDGTLLTSGGQLTDRTRHALERAAAVGWHVALVTGRPLAVALPVVHDLALGNHVVAANGATVVEVTTGRTVHQATLPAPLVIEVVGRLRAAIPGLGLAVTSNRGLFREPGFDQIAPLSTPHGDAVDDATPGADDEVHSVVLYVLGAETMRLLSLVRALVPSSLAVSPSGLRGSVELARPDVDKSSGLARLCDVLGVGQHEVVAFGDGLNDIGMLRWAGLGVAMGNAFEEAKAAADEVTATNDADGVAVVVERLLVEAGRAHPMPSD